MKKNIIHIVVGIFLLASCSNNDKKEEAVNLILNDSKTEITTILDSSNTSFVLLIEELKNNPSDINDIKKRFHSLSKDFEHKIESELNNLNELGKQGKITNEEADKWTESLETSQSMNNYKLITHLIDSLERDVEHHPN